jgi:hypothetical protein
MEWSDSVKESGDRCTYCGLIEEEVDGLCVV